jgi:DNA-binding NarL/FixJ family response regulator
VIVLTSVSEEDATVVQAHLSPRAATRLMQEMRSPSKNVRLTEREREVLREIAAGRTNKQIAQSLHVALSTIKCHVRAVMGKLDAESRTQAAIRALRTQTLLADELQST